MTCLSLADAIDRDAMPVPECGCWLWTGYLNNMGYGMINQPGETKVLAHRASWTVFRGPIPSGLLVLHKCDIPRCVNPDHLFLGTHKQNTQDMIAKRRDGHGYNPGEKSKSSKLTEAKVNEIRSSSEMGTVLAKRYSISTSVISAVRHRHIWKHI